MTDKVREIESAAATEIAAAKLQHEAQLEALQEELDASVAASKDAAAQYEQREVEGSALKKRESEAADSKAAASAERLHGIHKRELDAARREMRSANTL
jgi:chromosome segregation ATPase